MQGERSPVRASRSKQKKQEQTFSESLETLPDWMILPSSFVTFDSFGISACLEELLLLRARPATHGLEAEILGVLNTDVRDDFWAGARRMK